MFDWITALGTNLFRTFILKKFMAVFFLEEVENVRKERTVYLLFFIATTAVYLAFHFPPANILTNILMIYGITQLYEGNQKKKILVTMLIYGINMICDVFAVYTFSDYIVGGDYNEIAAYVTVLLISICEFIIERYAVKKRYVSFIPPYWDVLICIPAVSIILLFILLMSNLNNQFVLVSVSAGILLINMLIFYLYNALMDAYLRLEDKNLLERQAASYANQLDVLMQSEEKIRALRHDMKHHLNELAIMAARKENREIADYIESMQGFMTNTKEYLSSGNKEVDSILNYMLSKAEHAGVNTEYKVNLPREIGVQVFDLNVIFGNLLENAILAAEQSEDRWVSLFVRYEKGMLFMEIKNSYSHHLNKKGKQYFTTKRDAGEHGIGLQNVRMAVNKYHGNMEISDEESVFAVRIMMYTTEDK